MEGETATTEEFTITLAVIITKRVIYWIVNRDETLLFQKKMPHTMMQTRFKTMIDQLTHLFDGNDLFS